MHKHLPLLSFVMLTCVVATRCVFTPIPYQKNAEDHAQEQGKLVAA